MSDKSLSRALLILFVGLAVTTGCVAVGEISPTDVDPWLAVSADGGELTPPTTQELTTETPPAPKRAADTSASGIEAPVAPAPAPDKR